MGPMNRLVVVCAGYKQLVWYQMWLVLTHLVGCVMNLTLGMETPWYCKLYHEEKKDIFWSWHIWSWLMVWCNTWNEWFINFFCGWVSQLQVGFHNCIRQSLVKSTPAEIWIIPIILSQFELQLVEDGMQDKVISHCKFFLMIYWRYQNFI